MWEVPQEKEKSVKDTLQNIDGMEEAILAYDNLKLEDINVVLQPAPFIADKLDEHKERLFNEYLRLIGVSGLTIQKKERLIKDEVATLQGGSIANRYNRYEPRLKAVEEINKKFNVNIKVGYYDGVPSMDNFIETEPEDITDLEDIGGV